MRTIKLTESYHDNMTDEKEVEKLTSSLDDDIRNKVNDLINKVTSNSMPNHNSKKPSRPKSDTNDNNDTTNQENNAQESNKVQDNNVENSETKETENNESLTSSRKTIKLVEDDNDSTENENNSSIDFNTFLGQYQEIFDSASLKDKDTLVKLYFYWFCDVEPDTIGKLTLYTLVDLVTEKSFSIFGKPEDDTSLLYNVYQFKKQGSNFPLSYRLVYCFENQGTKLFEEPMLDISKKKNFWSDANRTYSENNTILTWYGNLRDKNLQSIFFKGGDKNNEVESFSKIKTSSDEFSNVDTGDKELELDVGDIRNKISSKGVINLTNKELERLVTHYTQDDKTITKINNEIVDVLNKNLNGAGLSKSSDTATFRKN